MESNSWEQESGGEGVEGTTLASLVSTLALYRSAILLSVAAVALATSIVALAIYVMSPTRYITSLDFRLTFDGAQTGAYPNGLRFSTAEITSTPNLLEVYSANGLQQYVSINEFVRSIFVVESNRAYEALVMEYRTRLADPKLTAIDRERLEREFNDKRASLSKADYSINYVQIPRARVIPRTIVKKVLMDVLTTWARDAANKKKVLQYRTPVLSANIIDRSALLNSPYPIIALIELRKKTVDVLANAHSLENMPGSELVRTKDGVSLSEIQLGLDDLLRFQLEPAIAGAYASGGGGDASIVRRIVDAQLAYDERELANAQAQVTALNTALSAFERTGNGPSTIAATDTNVRPSRNQPSSDSVTPQLSEGFLDRLLELTSRSADRDYREGMANDIRHGALAVIPAQQAVSYDHQLIDMLSRPPAGSSPGAVAMARQQTAAAIDQIVRRIQQVNDIYTTVSRQLNPSTELYSTGSPGTTTVERSTSLSRMLMYVIFFTLLTIPIAAVLSLVHAQLRREESVHTADAAEPHLTRPITSA